MRNFRVVVFIKGKPAHYPYMNISDTLAVMKRLESRGVSSLANTQANGINENLTLSELKEINKP